MQTTEGAPIWGEGIRALRGIRNLTQTELAVRAEVRQSTISRLERGTNQASDSVRIRIARALGVEPHILFPYIEEQAS